MAKKKSKSELRQRGLDRETREELIAEAQTIALDAAGGDEAEAQAAYERAEAWAQSPAGTPYGAGKDGVR